MILVSEWIVRLTMAAILVVPVLFFHGLVSLNVLTIVNFIVLPFTSHLRFDLLLMSKLSRHDVLFILLLTSLILASLLFLEHLQAHPLLITACLLLITHLLLCLFAPVHFSEISDFFCFFNFLLHEPFVHGFAATLVFLTLRLGHIQQLFLDLVLGLSNQLTLEAFLCVFALEPIGVAQP